MKRAAALLLALCGAASALAQVPSHPGSVREEARVERVVVDAYVTDRRGEPIPGLTVSDFRVKVDGRSVDLESAEWVPAETAEVPARLPELPLPGAKTPERLPPPGRLLIFFFQTSFEPSRLVGFLRMAIQARRFVDGLLPTDRVAILSFDSHLKLRQDFTGDRWKIEEAIDRSLVAGPAPPPDPEAFPSLAKNFDFRAAKKAVTPERSLALIARAAAPIPGGKSMLFFGWGLGTIGGLSGPVPAERRDWADALRLLASARISIFTLDVTDADYHSLETSIERIADLTGGTYQKTHIFPSLAMDRVRRAISGRYVLVFKKPDFPRGTHGIEVALAHREGDIRARQYYED